MVWEQRWRQGGHWWGWEGPWLVSVVAWYGLNADDAAYWRGFFSDRVEAVTDRCATAEEAMRQVEKARAAATAGTAGTSSRRRTTR